MQDKEIYNSTGMFLGYFDHSPAIRLGHGGTFRGGIIDEERERFQAAYRKLSNEHVQSTGPVFYSSFGYADEIVLASVQDFSEVSQLAAHSRRIDTYTMANVFSDRLFSSANDLGRVVDPWTQLGSSDAQPLILTSHIKIHGILTLALGLHVQIATAALISRRISELLSVVASVEPRRESAKLLEGADLSSVRISILDPVASEDLLLLIFCDNFSVGGMIISAIRNLTFKDLWEDDENGWLRYCLETNPIESSNEFCPADFVNRFASLATPQVHHLRPNGISSAVDGNHLLASSYTTLGAAAPLTELEFLSSRTSGYVSALSLADVCPGHERESVKNVRRIWNSARPIEPEIRKEDFAFVYPGKHDLALDMPVSNKQSTTCIATTDVFRIISGMYRNTKSASQESGFSDMSTILAIPIPRWADIRSGEKDKRYTKLIELLDPSVEHASHVDTMRVLENVSGQLEERFGIEFGNGLSENLKRLGVGIPTRNSVARLYGEFLSALTDPLLFDSVIDLLDCFELLHGISETAAETISNLHQKTRLQETVIIRETIRHIIEALDQAFQTRIGRSSAKKEERYGDLRGSITDLVLAGDAALKCTLGILRTAVTKHAEHVPKDPLDVIVAGTIAAQLDQRARCWNGTVGGRRVSVVSMDGNQLFRPDHLTRVVHEVAHLYFEAMVMPTEAHLASYLKSLDRHGKTLASNALRVVYLRLSELFADSFVQHFVFRGEDESFLQYQLSLIESLSTELTDPQDCSLAAVLREIVESLYRLFLLCANRSMPTEISRNAFAESFGNFVAEHRSSINLLRNVPEDDLRETAFTLAAALFEELPIVRSLVFERIGESILLHQSANATEDSNGVIQEIQRGVLNGTPFPFEYKGSAVRESVAVFLLMRCYVSSTFGKFSLDLYDAVDDRFILSGPARQELFRTTSVVTKSLWHISCRQRARRYNKLMQALASRSEMQ